MNIIFKKASHSELPDALKFFKLASLALQEKKVNQWDYWQNPPKDKIDWVQEGFENNEFYFVFDLSGNKIAMFRLLETDTLYWEEKGLENDVRYVHSLVVLPSYGGKGVGKAVMLKIIEQLKQENIKKFRLDCNASNLRLCQYYESYGFQKVGEKITKYSVNNLYELSLG